MHRLGHQRLAALGHSARDLVPDLGLPLGEILGVVAVTAEVPGHQHAVQLAASTRSVRLTRAPVCELAARLPASLAPTVITTTGFPAAAAASTNARPSRKSSA